MPAASSVAVVAASGCVRNSSDDTAGARTDLTAICGGDFHRHVLLSVKEKLQPATAPQAQYRQQISSDTHANRSSPPQTQVKCLAVTWRQTSVCCAAPHLNSSWSCTITPRQELSDVNAACPRLRCSCCPRFSAFRLLLNALTVTRLCPKSTGARFPLWGRPSTRAGVTSNKLQPGVQRPVKVCVLPLH